MRYSRGGIIAVLIAVEIFIAGAILAALNGHSFAAQAGGLHHLDQGSRSFAAIDAGDAPHVVIDDPNSGVGITPSSDGKIHVTDASQAHGWFLSRRDRAPLQVSRTADGVSIARPEEHGGTTFAVFGFDDEHIDVAVPAGSLLEIRRCSGAQVSGLTGEVRVHSIDGRITASNVHATALELNSDDGSLRLADIIAPSIDASTNDGSIRAAGLQVGGGTLRTDDGSVTIDLQNSNLTVHARTADGSVRFNGQRASSDNDSAGGDYQVGSGGGSLAVSTQDGSIHITTNGAQ